MSEERALELLLVHPAPGELSPLLASMPAMAVAEAPSLGEALAHPGRTRASIVLAALELPDSHGLATLERLLAAAPQAAVGVIVEEPAMGEAAIHRGATAFVATAGCGELVTRERVIKAVLDLRIMAATAARSSPHRQSPAAGELSAERSFSHDFNNLLQVIYGAAEELGDAELSEPQARALARLRAAAHRGMELIRRLDASRPWNPR